MYSRWFNLAVLLLWLASMSWLVTQKVLPSLLVGEPPNYATIVAAQRNRAPVGWVMLWDGERLGWALSTTTPLPHGLTELHHRIHFDALPVSETAPDWLRTLLHPLGQMRSQLHMEAVSTLVFDPLGRLSRFESAIQFQPKVDAIKVRGTIDGGTLTLTARAGDFTCDTEVPLPGNAMLSDALSPQTRLPGLREGQTWTIEVYSPLRPPNSPRDILQARVGGKEPVHWEGRTIQCWLVEYRSDPGAGVSKAGESRGKAWVHFDGTVLKQEMRLLNSTMTLVRLPDKAAAVLARAVAREDKVGYHDGTERNATPGNE